MPGLRIVRLRMLQHRSAAIWHVLMDNGGEDEFGILGHKIQAPVRKFCHHQLVTPGPPGEALIVTTSDATPTNTRFQRLSKQPLSLRWPSLLTLSNRFLLGNQVR